MTRLEIQHEVMGLPLEDRLALAEAIWDSAEQATLPLPDWQCRLLDERIAEDDATPDSGSSWPEVKKRLLASL
jgi:putative addiction module component (TIGR02574 family)